MGAIKERLQLPIENVMAYIQAEPHDQVVVELIWEAVKERADAFCNNPFLNRDGAPAEIPGPVKLWCLEVTKRKFEQRANGLVAEQVSGLGSATWGDLDYSDLWPYRRLPGL